MTIEKKHILIIDDELEIRTVIQEILSEEGYSTDIAESAVEAEIKIKNRTPDLVFLDIWMPDIDGISLLKKWSTEHSINFPVIMISGHATIETAIEATKLGAIDFIEKPISMEKLFDALNNGFNFKESILNEDILSYILRKSKTMSDIFNATLGDSIARKKLFIVGENGTEKHGWARYLHLRTNKDESNFKNLHLNMLSADHREVNAFKSSILEEINEIKTGTLYINGFSTLNNERQSMVLSVIEDMKINDNINRFIAIDANFDNEGFEFLVNEYCLEIPPLRKFLDEIPELLKLCVEYFSRSEGLKIRRFSLASQNMLTKYSWPGNIKQLIDMVHATLIRQDKEIINIEEIEETLTLQGPQGNLLVQSDIMTLSMKEAKQQFERAFLTRQLEIVDGKISELSRRVGMERTNLYRKLQSLGIKYKK